MSGLLNQIQNDYKMALKAGDKVVVSVLRLLSSAIHEKEIEKRARGEKVTEEDIFGTVQKQIKTGKESIEAYKKGQREDLVEKEKKELAVLQEYLPRQLKEEELEKIVNKVIQETKPQGVKDMGRVMRQVMERVRGKAGGKVVSEMVKQKLGAR